MCMRVWACKCVWAPAVLALAALLNLNMLNKSTQMHSLKKGISNRFENPNCVTTKGSDKEDVMLTGGKLWTFTKPIQSTTNRKITESQRHFKTWITTQNHDARLEHKTMQTYWDQLPEDQCGQGVFLHCLEYFHFHYLPGPQVENGGSQLKHLPEQDGSVSARFCSTNLYMVKLPPGSESSIGCRWTMFREER